jgi:RNA polymerase sigma factor (sigma-70 family)
VGDDGDIAQVLDGHNEKACPDGRLNEKGMPRLYPISGRILRRSMVLFAGQSAFSRARSLPFKLWARCHGTTPIRKMSGFARSNVYVIERQEKSKLQHIVNSLATMLSKVRAVVLRNGVAPQDADDVLHEAFVRLESYTRKQEVRSREAFLVTAAVNLGRDRARHRARVPVDNEEFDLLSLADAAPLPEEQLLTQERLRRVNSGMRRLDPQTRRCLMAKRLDGLTAAQIAERENLGVAAVEKRIARALLFLTQWMGES